MAELIRAAIDEFLKDDDDLESTFGSVPGIAARVPPRAEWDGRG